MHALGAERLPIGLDAPDSLDFSGVGEKGDFLRSTALSFDRRDYLIIDEIPERWIEPLPKFELDPVSSEGTLCKIVFYPL
jgi:hypothetical protein